MIDGTMMNLERISMPVSDSYTVSSRVYNAIAQSLLLLDLVPGSRMSEQEIAAQLGVSRTPVREAFIRLSRERLLIVQPQKGTIVAKISLSRVKQEHFLRESLEQAALEQFIFLKNDQAVEELQRILALQREAIGRNDDNEFFQYDDAFHRVFFSATNNLLSHQVIQRNCFDYFRIRRLSTRATPQIQALNAEQHEEILSCVKKSDLQQAQAALRKHVRRLSTELKELAARYPDYFLQEDEGRRV